MATPNRFLEDAARVAGGAIGTLSVLRELDNLVRHQLDRLLAGMDFVTRENSMRSRRWQLTPARKMTD